MDSINEGGKVYDEIPHKAETISADKEGKGISYGVHLANV